MGNRVTHNGRPEDIPLRHEHVTPSHARRLWQAVLLQAIADALMRRKSATTRERVESWRADMWLTHGGQDFDTVCEYAGFKTEVVRDWWKTVRAIPEDERPASISVALFGRTMQKHGDVKDGSRAA